ncbi:MAG: hypothetical protein R6U26_02765 [Candidatus Undinarchaeales archaeon]
MVKEIGVSLEFDSKNAVRVKFEDPQVSLSFASRYVRLLRKYHQVKSGKKVGAGHGPITFANYELTSKKFGEIALLVSPGVFYLVTGKAENEDKFIDFLIAALKTPPEEETILKKYSFDITFKNNKYFEFRDLKDYPTLEHYASLAD